MKTLCPKAKGKDPSLFRLSADFPLRNRSISPARHLRFGSFFFLLKRTSTVATPAPPSKSHSQGNAPFGTHSPPLHTYPSGQSASVEQATVGGCKVITNSARGPAHPAVSLGCRVTMNSAKGPAHPAVSAGCRVTTNSARGGLVQPAVSAGCRATTNSARGAVQSPAAMSSPLR
jgi:hypothetical protein